MVQRFILLSHARSGSTLLSQAMGAHPAVVMCDELFHADAEERQGQITDPARVLQPLHDWYRDGADPVAFLKTHLYGRTWPAEKQAVGFKLFHPHARSGVAAHVWDWLIAESDIRVIDSFRQRLLGSFVSRATARQTGVWEEPVGGGPKPHVPPFPIDIGEFKQYVDELTNYRDLAAVQFANHPIITLEYDADLKKNFDDTMRRVQEFLGVEAIALPQKLSKQAHVPMNERITNFEEVCETLQGSKYEAYL